MSPAASLTERLRSPCSSEPPQGDRDRPGRLVDTVAGDDVRTRDRTGVGDVECTGTRHGDVSRLINAALAGVNLKTIKVEVREKTRGTTKADLISRTVMFEAPLLKAAQETAQQRGVSFNALVDAAVAAQFGPPQKL